MPEPSHALCWYDGPDTTAQVAGNGAGAWFSRCHCGTMTCEAGSYEQVLAALEAHRALTAES